MFQMMMNLENLTLRVRIRGTQTIQTPIVTQTQQPRENPSTSSTVEYISDIYLSHGLCEPSDE